MPRIVPARALTRATTVRRECVRCYRWTEWRGENAALPRLPLGIVSKSWLAFVEEALRDYQRALPEIRHLDCVYVIATGRSRMEFVVPEVRMRIPQVRGLLVMAPPEMTCALPEADVGLRILEFRIDAPHERKPVRLWDGKTEWRERRME